MLKDCTLRGPGVAPSHEPVIRGRLATNALITFGPPSSGNDECLRDMLAIFPLWTCRQHLATLVAPSTECDATCLGISALASTRSCHHSRSWQWWTAEQSSPPSFSLRMSKVPWGFVRDTSLEDSVETPRMSFCSGELTLSCYKFRARLVVALFARIGGGRIRISSRPHHPLQTWDLIFS